MTISNGKIITLDEAADIVLDLKRQGKRIVLAPGCFDFFHVGHLHHLKQARSFGDILIISLTPDCYVGKGPGRPVYSQDYRAELLAALEIVDYVCLNKWPHQGPTVRQINPDVFVVGKEYRLEGSDMLSNLEERQAADELGVTVAFTDDRIFSSTEIIQKYFGDKK
jgi:rfaE bifunctional protein nucleotidyltransferase chain/domain